MERSMGHNNHGFKDLLAYKRAYSQACQIFELTEGFPKEEK